MPRDRQRVPLESGPVLDLARLIPKGSGQPGAVIRSTLTYASGTTLRAEVRLMEHGGVLDLRYRGHPQSLTLVFQARPYGGRQWYVICPSTGRRVRVLFRPAGATAFASRHAWGRQVAYASQYLTPTDRAWRTKAKVKARLLGDADPDEWDLPPRPKGMRQSTYERLEGKYDRAEEVLEQQCLTALARLIPNRT
ncbi:MAG TPA: hypothetical protein VGU45_12330 [Microvirga sp.]|jgi:hypothetical protein|nr:hypothetical protein [Microvirga sp.]